MKIIAFAGEMHSGKDTSADYLVENYGYKKLAFATNLKEMCKKVLGLSHEQCYDQTKKFEPFGQMIIRKSFFGFKKKKVFQIKPITLTAEHIKGFITWFYEVNGIELTKEQIIKMFEFVGTRLDNPRHALQFVGTDICRKVLGENYHSDCVKHEIDKNKYNKVAIADSRFANERKAVTDWGGINILLNGRSAKTASSAAKAHESENSLGSKNEYDFTIYNDRDKEYLYACIDDALEAYCHFHK